MNCLYLLTGLVELTVQIIVGRTLTGTFPVDGVRPSTLVKARASHMGSTTSTAHFKSTKTVMLLKTRVDGYGRKRECRKVFREQADGPGDAHQHASDVCV